MLLYPCIHMGLTAARSMIPTTAAMAEMLRLYILVKCCLLGATWQACTNPLPRVALASRPP